MSALASRSASTLPKPRSPAPAPVLERQDFLWCAASIFAALLPLAQSLAPWFALLVFGIALIATGYGWRQRILSAWVRLPLTLFVAGAAFYAYDFRFGRDTGGALLAAMLALKLLELRRPRDARSVLSYSLFALMAAFLQDQSPLTFALALTATVLIVATLARTSQLAPPPSTFSMRGEIASQLQAAAWLLVLSLPLAVVGFFLVPRLATPLWGLPGNAGEARTGLGNEMSPGDMVKLFSDDSPALRVQFFGVPPEQSELYWRGPVLVDFDGRKWTRSPRASEFRDDLRGRDEAPELVPLGSAVDYEIVQEPTDRRYLVALDLPLAAPEFMRMAFDGTLYAARPQTDLSRYRASSVTSYRFEPNLPAHQRESYLALPPGFNPRTRALVAQWRAEDASPEALVQRALDWFGAEFTYTVEPQLLGRDSVDDFLFNTQEGYCEYYASAFVVMMRMAQLPARVVTGYQGAYRNTIGDYWVVRHSDAHAWTEVWQEGRGWVRVDPTSAVSPARIERGTEALSGPQPFWGRLGGPLFEAGDWLQRHWNDLVLGFNAAQQRNLLHVFGLRDGSARDFGLILGIGAGIALAITLGVLLRAPRGPRDPLRRAYAEFLARLARAGVPKAAHEGPLAYAERVASALPESAAHVRTLSQRYARWRYAATATSTSEGATLRDDLQRFRVTRPTTRTARGPT